MIFQANRNQIMAFSLEASETSDSYDWFAQMCKKAGLGALFDVAPGPLKRKPVCFSDGFKGTESFTRVLTTTNNTPLTPLLYFSQLLA